MKVTLAKDLLLTSTEVGRAGESHTVSKDLGLHLVREGFATEVSEEGAAATKPSDPRTRQTKPLKDAPETK